MNSTESTQSRQSTAAVEHPEAGITDFVRFRDLTREQLETPGSIEATPLHERAFRWLSRRSPVALAVTGFEGVGRTEFVSELAGLCATGQGLCGPSRRYVLFDVRHVPEEDSRFCLEAILARSARQPDLLPCLTGLARLLRPAQQDSVRACRRSCPVRNAPQALDNHQPRARTLAACGISVAERRSYVDQSLRDWNGRAYPQGGPDNLLSGSRSDKRFFLRDGAEQDVCQQGRWRCDFSSVTRSCSRRPTRLGQWIARIESVDELPELHNSAHDVLMRQRRIHDTERHAHFVTFSCFKRRRMLDHDRAKRIVLGVLHSQLAQQRG